MFNIVKQLTNILLSVIFISQACVASAAEMTPLELKAMQTRKFAKPAVDVLEAIKVSGEDNDGQCHTELAELLDKGVMKTVEVFCMFTKMPANDPYAKVPIIGTLRALKDLTTQETELGMVKYQVSVSKNKETIVRMRIMGRDNVTPINKPEIYSQEFKRIGDALFIQAIEINPAKQE